jgi:hypothetical protein
MKWYTHLYFRMANRHSLHITLRFERTQREEFHLTDLPSFIYPNVFNECICQYWQEQDAPSQSCSTIASQLNPSSSSSSPAFYYHHNTRLIPVVPALQVAVSFQTQIHPAPKTYANRNPIPPTTSRVRIRATFVSKSHH